jgi:hypothetical protein
MNVPVPVIISSRTEPAGVTRMILDSAVGSTDDLALCSRFGTASRCSLVSPRRPPPDRDAAWASRQGLGPRSSRAGLALCASAQGEDVRGRDVHGSFTL